MKQEKAYKIKISLQTFLGIRPQTHCLEEWIENANEMDISQWVFRTKAVTMQQINFLWRTL